MILIMTSMLPPVSGIGRGRCRNEQGYCHRGNGSPEGHLSPPEQIAPPYCPKRESRSREPTRTPASGQRTTARLVSSSSLMPRNSRLPCRSGSGFSPERGPKAPTRHDIPRRSCAWRLRRRGAAPASRQALLPAASRSRQARFPVTAARGGTVASSGSRSTRICAPHLDLHMKVFHLLAGSLQNLRRARRHPWGENSETLHDRFSDE